MNDVVNELGNPLLRVRRIDASMGCAFLIAPTLVVTCHHVLPSVAHARSATIEWNPPPRSEDFPAPRSRIVLRRFDTSASLDLTVVGSSNDLRSAALASSVDPSGIVPRPGELFWIIDPRTSAGRPGAIPAEVFAVEPPFIRYLAPTPHGFSGAPIVDEDGRLVAMHQSSGRSPCGSDRRSDLRAGLLATTIWEHAGVALEGRP